MPVAPARLIRHIEACTNAVLPGGRSRLRIGASAVGWVHGPAPILPDRAAFEAHVAQLRQAGAFMSREELFDVRDDSTGAVLAQVDRGAIPLLGIAATGVHMNGLARRPDGLHLWVARRAKQTKLDPGKLDHVTAGGIPAGHDPWSTLVKEAAEEASLNAALVRQAKPVGTLTYAMEREGGLRRDRLHCFDLFIPDSEPPRPHDHEVETFTLMSLHEVLHRVAETDDFKFNVNLVLIDLFLRSGLIPPTGDVAQAMRRVRR